MEESKINERIKELMQQLNSVCDELEDYGYELKFELSFLTKSLKRVVINELT